MPPLRIFLPSGTTSVSASSLSMGRSRASRVQAVRRRSTGHITESMPSRLTPRNRNGTTLAGKSLPPARPQAATLPPSLAKIAVATLPTPPAAPVTSTSPLSGVSPCSSRAMTASIAVKPAVPIAMARLVVSPFGSFTSWPALTRAFSSLMGASAQPLEDAGIIRHRRAPHVEDAGEFGILDLYAARGSRQLHGREHMHGNAGGADGVALGLEPARRVDRELAVLFRPAFHGGARALPFGREADRLVDQEFGDGEAVMHLGETQIVELDLGIGERTLEGAFRALEGGDVALAHRQVIVDVLGRPEHHRLVTGERGLDVGQHHGGGAVGDE